MEIIIALAAAALLFIFFKLTLIKPYVKKPKPKLFIPGYKIIYSDAREGGKKEGVIYSRTLKSERYGLTGKPDYIFGKSGKRMIPVELKSGEIGDATEPHRGDLMQLTAYFLIIAEEFSVKPKQGRIIYKDCMFIIRNTKKLRRELLTTTEEMRRMLQTDGVSAGTQTRDFIKCRNCVCRETVCRTDGGE